MPSSDKTPGLLDESAGTRRGMFSLFRTKKNSKSRNQSSTKRLRAWKTEHETKQERAQRAAATASDDDESTRAARDEMTVIAKRLYDKNFLAACDGNISVRHKNDAVLLTPSG